MSNDVTAVEQQAVTERYALLDGARTTAQERLDEALRRRETAFTAQAEREAAVRTYSRRLVALDAAENGLCFGRLDLDDGEERYVGRVGLADDEGDPALFDWRSPAAQPFYVATGAEREGVRRRRHLRTQGRRVVAVHDDVLDLAAVDAGDVAVAPDGAGGESVLLAALDRARTGTMTDIVATVQADQDRVIRAPQRGVLVVEGGPGTGKTAVALHRIAYLLYAERERLERRGVLCVGPSEVFLRYVGDVLPSLGETGVLFATLGELFPGVRADAEEPRAVADLKGDARMADVVAAAVRAHEAVPDAPVPIPYEGTELVVRPDVVAAVGEKARATQALHNEARPVFAEAMLEALARQEVDRLRTDMETQTAALNQAEAELLADGDAKDLLDETDVADLVAELRTDEVVRATVEELWPLLSPAGLVAALWSDADLLAETAPYLTVAERTSLHRPANARWTPADVPLLDEAAELLGDDPEASYRTRTEADELEAAAIEYAEGVLEVQSGSALTDREEAHEEELELLEGAPDAASVIDAATLAARQVERDTRSVADRAAADRTWAFGHVVADEAQELSPMAWRLLLRRCPTRSLTIVGDPAQTASLAGAAPANGAWASMLKPFVDDRWRLERLTVNYRTPAEIMAVAADVVTAAEPGLPVPDSVRSTGTEPWHVRVPAGALPDRVAELAADEAARLAAGDGGRVAVLVPASLLGAVGAAVRAERPDASVGTQPDLRAPVVVLPVERAKGLEFDVVLVAEPGLVLAGSPVGHHDLYVALTRATQRLGVIHSDELPAELGRLTERP